MKHQEILDRGILELPEGIFDAHVHFRWDERTGLVVPETSHYAWGVIIEPNTEDPHITSIPIALDYRKTIHRATPVADRPHFIRHFTLYLTDDTNPSEVEEGFKRGVWVAAKLYPLLGTTGANKGVSDLSKIARVLYRMQKIGMPLQVHGEAVHEDHDPLDMERIFVEKTLLPFLLENFPTLTIILEHISTKEAAELVASGKYPNLYATVTPQHLLYEHKDIFQRGRMIDRSFKRGLRPDFFCLPILKTCEHREALRKAVASGCSRIGAGTDSAPWFEGSKYCECGCAGCFTATVAPSMYAQSFHEIGALEMLPSFLGINIPSQVYKLSRKETGRKVRFVHRPFVTPKSIGTGNERINILDGGRTFQWSLEVEDRAV